MKVHHSSTLDINFVIFFSGFAKQNTDEGNPTCEDIDDCRFSDCHSEATCENYSGSFNCSCNPGFELDTSTECGNFTFDDNQV